MDLEENMRLIHCKCDRDRLTFIDGMHFSATDFTSV